MPRVGVNFKPAELVAIGHALYKITGQVPARDDFLPAARHRVGELLGIDPVPSTYHFQKEFGSWKEYLKVCGYDQEGGSDLNKIERAAANHTVQVLGVTEETAERSVVDGWLPDGTPIEIKGSVLRQHEATQQHFFGFRIHGRTLSTACDKLVLVGLSKDLEPIVRIEIPKDALINMVDGKSNVTIYAPSLWGTGASKYRRYVTWIKPNSLPGAISDWSAGLPTK